MEVKMLCNHRDNFPRERYYYTPPDGIFKLYTKIKQENSVPVWLTECKICHSVTPTPRKLGRKEK